MADDWFDYRRRRSGNPKDCAHPITRTRRKGGRAITACIDCGRKERDVRTRGRKVA